ncbi:MAG: S9 family peptidase [Ktedonobacterales bacterium]|nr:S9 family peptidase [Ktedonobacterales bacterium]
MAKRRSLTPDDYWRMHFITDLRLSPHGTYLAYVVESSEREVNERRSAIWLMDTASGVAIQFTSGRARDFSPRWSPDGARLAFLSTREGQEPQVWVMAVDGGEARQLTHMRRGASDPFWSSDGTWLGFTSEVRPGEAPTEAPPKDAAARARQEREEAERPRIFTRLVYRWDGKGYFEGRTHLFRAALADGAVEPLTDGDYDDGEGTCSPDGRWLAFISDRGARRDANMATDLWLLDLTTRATRRLTSEQCVVMGPAWSPDGSRLAFLATREVGEHSAYHTTLMLADPASGALTDLLAGWDRGAEVRIGGDIPQPPLSAPVWSADGTRLRCLAQRGGGVEVLRVPVNGGPARVAVAVAAERATIQRIALAPDGARLFALRNDTTRTWDIWDYPSAKKHAPRRLTEMNRALLEKAHVTAPERFTCASCDGTEIEAWLYRPVSRHERAPLVLSVHGGPHSAYGFSFSLLTQMLVGRGYAVLQANPRGSAGYGEAFLQACDHDWGGGDYLDLMAALEAALARGGLDAERLAVMGVSYGGYMTNWIVTQTDRFRAAVSIYGIANLWSMFGTADMDPVWAGGDYGWPWEREAFYRERSPLTHAARVTTPLRIIGAEQDFRCPISQSEEWFTWLKLRGHAAVDLVRLPRASHMTYASPGQRVRRMQLVLEWIARYCPAE